MYTYVYRSEHGCACGLSLYCSQEYRNGMFVLITRECSSVLYLGMALEFGILPYCWSLESWYPDCWGLGTMYMYSAILDL